MKITLLLSCVTCLFLRYNSISQCNGLVENCGKKFDEVAYLTTHNAFNAGSEGFSFPNQNNSIAQQLDDGVRGFMLDVYDFFGTPTVYHGSFVLGSATLESLLVVFKNFLDNNPNEVVTIILECYVSAGEIESEINSAGLAPYLYTKEIGDWATLQEMIDNNTRLVVLSDVDDSGPGQEWYHYMWDHCTETHYSVGDPQDFNNDFNRGDPQNDLFIFNHFVTDPLLGTGDEGQSAIVNEQSFLENRILNNYSVHVKFPNFITLDFYEIGNGMTVVNNLNLSLLQIPDGEIPLKMKCYPNPATGKTTISVSTMTTNSLKVELTNSMGETMKVIDLQGQLEHNLDLSELNSGFYFLRILNDSGDSHTEKLIVQ